LKKYDTSKGTIRFQPDDPLPVTLVRKLVRARIARNAAQTKQRAERASRSRPKRKTARRVRKAR
jgi:uncharacterized protein YdhG (YjbR/CyaY superfamily)